MLIGIDASRSTVAARTGTENYSLHLIRGMLALGTRHRFRLYFNQEPSQALFVPALGPAELCVIPFPRLWTHVRLSLEMRARPPDLLFVPSHVLPLLHPARCVATIHDLGYHYHPEAHTLSQNLYLRWSTRYNARAATMVVADSEATRRDLGHYYGVPAEKITVVYPGVDEALEPVSDPELQAAPRARFGLGRPYLLYLGTLHPRKNLVRLVQAFAQAAGELDSSLTLVLAGRKGWLFEEIQTQIRRLGLADRILLTGYIPDADKAAVLSGALAFVFPSLYEGFGLPVLEAMACGVPVVCSSTSSLPEVAGDAALLVDPLDVDALARGLMQIVTDAGLRRELVQRGFDQARKFSWHRCAEETMQVLEEVGIGLD